ncbi:MAG: DUF3990 domain-containing protein [Dysgonamonadaceae bacterium]|jgi:hypothetical protein|nr:DUF3990 domain-containing protein [Dysgonamonadaceae bacterium]
MIVYHGSYTKIDRIDFLKCRPYRDFGRGFYVTKIREQAQYWAERKGILNKTDAYVNEYEFVEAAFDNWELNVRRFDGYSESWLDFIVLNSDSTGLVPAHDYDIIEGPVADDDVAQRIDDYLDGAVTKSAFLKELKFRHPTHQICFCTHRSLQALKPLTLLPRQKIDLEIVKALIANLSLSEEQAIDLYFSSKTYQQLSEVSTENWQDVYNRLKQEFMKNRRSAFS